MKGELHLVAFAQALAFSATEGSAVAGTVAPSTEALVNGHATDAVYKILSREDRREHGIFFSGPHWAQRMFAALDIDRWQRFIDPSVGTGDLLLEICRRLPLEATVAKTLATWGSRLAAIELRSSFIQIAWARLQALAMTRHKQQLSVDSLVQASTLPNSFITGDALETSLSLSKGDCVVMNPPYQRMQASEGSFVGQGLRSAAALHTERVLTQAPAGVGLIALVPDVLRSGSSYRRFRDELHRRMEIDSFAPVGAFGGSANVDVAVLIGTTRSSLATSAPAIARSTKRKFKTRTLGDECRIAVGPVVPHRTKGGSTRYGYLTARSAPVWGEMRVPDERARFTARLETAPFVVVRRTSSPGDLKRARATIVAGTESWLLENHLLILRPYSGLLKDCRRLLKSLKNPRTDEWLNEHIRCRHLTVSALKLLPWWDDQD